MTKEVISQDRLRCTIAALNRINDFWIKAAKEDIYKNKEMWEPDKGWQSTCLNKRLYQRAYKEIQLTKLLKGKNNDFN